MTTVATSDGLGQLFPSQSNAAVTWPDPKAEFRKSTNEIEDKVWYEMDVSEADTIVILCEGTRVEMDKKAFLQAIGLAW